MSPNNTLTAVPGIKGGHATDPVGLTGCTVVLCEAGAVACPTLMPGTAVRVLLGVMRGILSGVLRDA